MAHFVKLNEENIVTQSIVVSNNIATTEQQGINFINNLYKTDDIWKQTSYNTKGGVHLLGGTPFRKNYAGIGYKYDETRNAFIPPQLFSSWTLNETTCLWQPPLPYPTNGKIYNWNEEDQQWDLQ